MAYTKNPERPDSYRQPTIRSKRERMNFWRHVKIEGSKLGDRIARMRSHSIQIAPAEYIAHLRNEIDKAVGRS